MSKFEFLPNKEYESMTPGEKKDYLSGLKLRCELEQKKVKRNIGQDLISAIYPKLRPYEITMSGYENIPLDDSAIFVCNHSNTHDGFTAYEMMGMLNRTGTVLAASDSLPITGKMTFAISNGTMVDRNSKESSRQSIFELSKKVLGGFDGIVFAESTWNLHPYLAMHDFKQGIAKVGAITGKKIIPTVMEYIEVPYECDNEFSLYQKCIIKFGKPFEINVEETLSAQTLRIQQQIEKMRREIWDEYGIKKSSIVDIDIPVYLNHTYLKKFGGLGFTYDSEMEQQFIFDREGKPVENEYTLNEQGEFVPGITLKKAR